MRSSLPLLFLLPAVAAAQVRGARTVAETNFRTMPRNTVGESSHSGQHRRLAVKGEGADHFAIEVRKGMGMGSTGAADMEGMGGMGATPGTSPTFAPGAFTPGAAASAIAAMGGMAATADGGMGMGATGGGMGMGTARGNGMGMDSGANTVPIVFPVAGVPVAGGMGMGTTGTDGMGSTAGGMGTTPGTTTGGMAGMGSDSRATLTSSSVNFVQDVYDAAIAVETASMAAPTLKEVGTVFTFRNYTIAMEFANLFAAGLCTRTEARTTTDRGISYCDFTYSIQDAQMSAFSASGAVMDALTTATGGLSGGGLLAVTGGSGVYFGARGEVSMTPFFNMGVDGDIFLDPSRYIMNATILV